MTHWRHYGEIEFRHKTGDKKGWTLIEKTEEEAVFSNVQVIMFRSIVTAVLAAVLGGILVVVFAGRLSRPIAELAESARRLASGDFSQNIDVTSDNEIGEFAETFNFMILEIRHFVERLRKAAEENKHMFLGAVSSLAAAIDAKDPYTAGHIDKRNAPSSNSQMSKPGNAQTFCSIGLSQPPRNNGSRLIAATLAGREDLIRIVSSISTANAGQ